MSDRPDNFGSLGMGDDCAPPPGPPPRDELDGLLREWHGVNAQRAAAGRDRLMASLGQEAGSRDQGNEASDGAQSGPRLVFVSGSEEECGRWSKEAGRRLPRWRRVLSSPLAPLAAAAVVALVLLPFVVPGKQGFVSTVAADPPARNIVLAPEAGRLEAFDRSGNLLGACALTHTDVRAEITGLFSRVTVRQEYKNSNPWPIEAVYAFPLGEGAAIDRMEMTVGDRVIAAEVQERGAAERTYSSGRDSARTASLLEMQRPNVFTQSVANIPPGEKVAVELSFVERVAARDGELSFTFPARVSPRFAAAAPADGAMADAGETRAGVVLSAPATVVAAEKGAGSAALRTPAELGRMLSEARPIEGPETARESAVAPLAGGPGPRSSVDAAGVWYDFTVEYPDGAREPGVLLADGRGEVGGRWFACDVDGARGEDGNAKATRTAGAETPATRAGHDLSIAVMLDSGGPGISGLESVQHAIARTVVEKNARGEARKISIGLDKQDEIPNRDFVLKWKESGHRIGVRTFAHAGEKGNFFSVQLEPPDRIADEAAMPREMVFAVDGSLGSDARAMDVARRVIERAVEGMRAQDKFNVISLAGKPSSLWQRGRLRTEESCGEARAFVGTLREQGGVDAVAGIETALGQRNASGDGDSPATLDELAKTPADGRGVELVVDDSRISSDGMKKGGELVNPVLEVRDGEEIRCTPFVMPESYRKRAGTANGDRSVRLELLIKGVWATEKEERVLRVSSAEMHADSAVRPVRVVVLLTSGLIGSEAEVLDAIRRGRGTARVFPLAIGQSIDLAAVERMARAGGGEAEHVYLDGATDPQIDEIVKRFTRRLRTPVLTDVSVDFSGVRTVDVLPASDSVPDLWSERPLMIIGRYLEAGSGTMTVRAQAATGRWEETIPLDLPEREAGNTCLPTLWASGMAEELLARDAGWTARGVPEAETRAQVVRLGETFNVVTPFTSIVAVERLRVVVEGKSRLVRVPEEASALAPAEAGWERYFGTASAMSENGLADKLAKRQSIAVNAGALRLNREGIERILKLALEHDRAKDPASMSDTRVAEGKESGGMPEVEKKHKKEEEATSRSQPGTRVGSPGSGGRPAGSAAIGGAPIAKIDERLGGGAAAPKPAAAITSGTGGPAAGSPPTPTNAIPAAPPQGHAAGERIPTGDETKERAARSAAMSAPPMVASGGAEPGKRAQAEWVNRAPAREQAAANVRFAAPRAGNETQAQQSDDNARLAPQQRRTLGVALDACSPTNDAPAAALTGCVSTLAAVALAEAGRDEDAQRVACQSATVLRSAAASNLNVRNVSNSAQVNNNDWRSVYSLVTNSQANAPVLNVEAAAMQLCGALKENAPVEQKRAAIEQARSAATAGYLENRRWVTLARKLSPELLTRLVGNDVSNVGQMSTMDLLSAAKAAPGGSVRGGYGGPKDQAPMNDPASTTGAYRTDAGTMAGERGAKGDADAAKSLRAGVDEIRRETARDESGTTGAAESVLVSMLLADTSDKTLDALRAAGVKIEVVRAELAVVVGRVPVGKLEEVGMMEVVRRVEVVAE